MLATAKTGKKTTQDRFWEKNAVEWTTRVEIRQEEIHSIVRHNMHGY